MISIIVPVYNVEKYIEVCLESILAQTYQDYEVVMVDDGSPDESAKICEQYALKDARFRLIHQENKGLASARNTGIREAKGEYIYFVDSDDAIDSRLLEIVLHYMEKYNAGIVQINLESVSSDYGKMDKEYINSDVDLSKEPIVFDRTQALYNLDKDNQEYAKDIRLATTVVWTKLYRRSAIQDLTFPEGMRLHEDQMVAHRFIFQAGGMVFVDIPLYKYRQNDNSLIRVGWTSKRLAILDCYKDRYGWIKKTKDKHLIEYFYYRYLVCLFRNYYMVSINMKGTDRKERQKEILTTCKSLFGQGRGQLDFKRRMFFELFGLFPNVIVRCFYIRQKMFRK